MSNLALTLSGIVWLPVASTLLFVGLKRLSTRHVCRMCKVVLWLQCGAVMWLLKCYAPSISAGDSPGIVASFVWFTAHLGAGMGSIEACYTLGVDGLNAGLVLLAALVFAIGVSLVCPVKDRLNKGFFVCYMLINAFTMGSLMALDFLCFYIFFEALLLPVFLCIQLYGGPDSTKAATQFLAWNLLASVPMLAVVLGLGLSVCNPVATYKNASHAQKMLTDTPHFLRDTSVRVQMQKGRISPDTVVRSFDLKAATKTQNFLPNSKLDLTSASGLYWRRAAFWLLIISFGIKLAAFPLHLWLPDAHVQAPTPLSIVLAGIVLKIGAYGLLRTAYSIFPQEALHYSKAIGLIGSVGILYAALNALTCKDFKRMVAYTSVSNMSSVLVGTAACTPESICGAVYQMVAHGIMTAALFLLSHVWEVRTQTRNVYQHNDVSVVMKRYRKCMLLALLLASGVPGSGYFVAKVLVVMGVLSRTAPYVSNWTVGLTMAGHLMTAACYIRVLQNIWTFRTGLKCKPIQQRPPDISYRECWPIVLMLAVTILLGIWPQPLLKLTRQAAGLMADQLRAVPAMG